MYSVGVSRFFLTAFSLLLFFAAPAGAGAADLVVEPNQVPGIQTIGTSTATTTATTILPTIATTTPQAPTTTPPQSPPPKPRQESPLKGFFDKIFSQIQSFVQKALAPKQSQSPTGETPPTNTPTSQQPGGQSGSGSSPSAGTPFGGPITIIKFCANGKIWVTLGPPTPGPYIWGPGTQTYLNGPPSHVGQNLLGTAAGADVCVIGKAVFPGQRMILLGSSGPGGQSSTPKPPAKEEKPQEKPKTPGTSSPTGEGTLTHDEAKKRLEQAGIEVTSTSGPDGVKDGCTGAGCTSLAGIRADTVEQAILLKQACGCRVVITAGTEGGAHDDGLTFSHSKGFKVDIDDTPDFDKYVRSNFEKIGSNRHRDSCGNIYYFHSPAHWDVKVVAPCKGG